MPKKDNSLGRSLIKAQRKARKWSSNEGFRHTSELADGRDFGRLNLASVTEQSSLNEFLDTAALAEDDFMTEMNNVKIVYPNSLVEESVQDQDNEILCIPRRPHWDLSQMSKEEIDENEKKSFLIWRRKLAVHEEKEGVKLTPFEKNIEVWRQLWRVIERSDVVVQILDARNPLLFRCCDFEAYVKEVAESKCNMLLLNKADFLTETQRKYWCDYFQANSIKVVFFSALQEGKRSPEDSSEDCNSHVSTSEQDTDFSQITNQSDILSREQLVNFFTNICKKFKKEQHVPTVGLVGYPNVGKSSTLNALLMTKKVCVSATPGKTKHFQTFVIDDGNLCLCDCPGLVFPNFISTKAEMVINGILPIDQLTEWNQPVSLVTKMIPRRILEVTYSILIPLPGEDRDLNSTPTAEEFLNAHGYNRGFMTKRGLPDNARSSRYVLKDFVNGKLLYCHAPPGVNQEDYHIFPEIKSRKGACKESSSSDGMKSEAQKILSDADRNFFSNIHKKGKGTPYDPNAPGKPWKKHNNSNKKEKLRRIYRGNPYE